MTEAELRALYNEAYRIVQHERRMREQVFKPGHPRREEKLLEMDKLLAILTTLKDALKPHCDAGLEQPRLLDVPRKAEYP
jgi:hypothetical protein